MFLSQLILNPALRQVVRDEADIHDLHRTVMSAYPDLPGADAARRTHAALWRLEITGRNHVLYVQSATCPNWASLPPGYSVVPPRTRSLQPLLDALRTDLRLRFRLRANPTRTVSGKRPGETLPTGTRVAIRDPQAQIEWIIRQGDQHGFALVTTPNGGHDLACLSQPRVQGHLQRGRAAVTIDPVHYDGRLSVTDTVKFSAALQTGLGRAKAYGCGLLSLARA